MFATEPFLAYFLPFFFQTGVQVPFCFEERSEEGRHRACRNQNKLCRIRIAGAGAERCLPDWVSSRNADTLRG